MIDKITLCKNLNNTRVKPHSLKYEKQIQCTSVKLYDYLLHMTPKVFTFEIGASPHVRE
jgi:hypothetical protein